ncbi:hypothetical protein AVEN_5498-1 [Araneus ventricosus]|uniref:Uncharacterized protein n=1 Tax=Araneus ventricosus TaxID=182803 RepID=A0A4Y2JQ48_ARAVE|nr:hypothetical protein AVEN_5498-1 [Araneus ventricosus]
MSLTGTGNHKKSPPRPSLASGSTLNDRLPRLHRALWPQQNSPDYERLVKRPPFKRDTTRHLRWTLRATPPLLPTGRRVPVYLSFGNSSVYSHCPAWGDRHR